MPPRKRLACRIHTRAHAVVVVRPIHVLLDVFLPRPDDLDGPAHLLRDLHGAQRTVVLEPAAESAAQQVVVDTYLLARQAGELHDRRLRETGHLCAEPDVAAAIVHLHGAVHRLHRRMREKRLLVDRIHLVGRAGDEGCGVTVMTGHGTGLLRRASELLHDVRRREPCIRAGIPPRRRGGEPLLGGPCMDRYDGHRVIEPDDLCHAWHGLSFRFVDTGEPPAKSWRSGHHCEFDSAKTDVDAELRGAVHFPCGVEAPMWRSYQGESGRILQVHVRWYWQATGRVDEGAVCELATARGVHDDTLLRATRRRIDVPTLGGGHD